MFAHMPKYSLSEVITTPFDFTVATDDLNSSRFMIEGTQSGITLEKKYHEENSTKAEEKRKHYLAYTTKLLSLAKFKDPKKIAKQNMLIETALAKASWSPQKNADIMKTRNPIDFKQLEEMMSHLDMPFFFESKGFPTDMKINIDQPSYFKTVNELAEKLPLEAWKDYLRVRLLLINVDYLSEQFINAKQAYNVSEGLSPKLEPLDIRAVRKTNENVAYLFGKIYIKHFFDEKSKAKVDKLLHTILDGYKDAIDKSARFDAKTKQAALKKIEKMHFNIAYPNVWRDYSSIKLSPNDLIGNLRTLGKLEQKWYQEDLKRGTVNKDQWGMPPQFVNAYYDPTANKFNLLAAILNPPFFDANASGAENYAGIGHVIAHEIGHAFDSWGSNYNEQGNMKNWWSKEDRKKFNVLKNALIAQADAYEILPDVYSNGEVEVGEIMADLSGAEIALAAYLKTIKGDEEAKQKATRDFFIHLAKVWKTNARKEMVIRLNDSNPHPANIYRINETVMNMDAFHKAFEVKKGDKMYLDPKKRVKIW